MEEGTKKWVLIAASIAGMGIFSYYAFFSPAETKESLTNPARLYEYPSKQSIYANKKKQQFEYDRMVSSLDDFLKNEIEEDPFDTTEVAIPAPQEDTIAAPVLSTPPNRIIKSPPPKKPVIAKPEADRRTSFASGSGEITAAVPAGKKSTDIHIPVVVHEDLMVVSGSVVMLRTLKPVNIGGMLIPEHTFIFGNVQSTEEKLFIEVSSITAEKRTIATSLEAYGLNGNKGLIITGGIDKEIAGQAMTSAVGEVQRKVNVPVLRDIPFTSAKRKIREKAIPLKSGLKFYLRKK